MPTCLHTAESVAQGHPDKLADFIADAVLDSVLRVEPTAHVACEVMLADQTVILAGEFGIQDQRLFDDLQREAPGLVRHLLKLVGYGHADTDIDPDACEVQVRFNRQSPDIAQGVDQGEDVLGAGDQGVVFGYACDETAELMPAPITFAHALMRQHQQLRQAGTLPWLRPDAKAQVSVRYVDGRPEQVAAIVLSTQHAEDVDSQTLRRAIGTHLIEPVIPHAKRTPDCRIEINPTGRFVIGGPKGDCGLTGRKLVVDTYGGACPHGGGAFSGKDPTKIDRAGAYAARWVAKHLVAARLATRATVQLAYAIGCSAPIAVTVDTHGTGRVPDARLADAVRQVFDLTPAGIIHDLNLRQPFYHHTAALGHFGRTDQDFPWEQVWRTNKLCEAAGVPAPGVHWQHQRNLSRMLHALDTGEAVSPALARWWMHRY